MWVEGMLDGVYRRESLKVSSWEKAEQIRREMEEGKKQKPVPIAEAIEIFLAEQTARALTESTLRKLRTLTASLSRFCQDKTIQTITQLDIGRVRQFRASWKDSPISAVKKLERTRSFFKFCVDSRWMNCAKQLPRGPVPPYQQAASRQRRAPMVFPIPLTPPPKIPAIVPPCTPAWPTAS